MSERIGDYEVLSVLGAGGMGKVFKVRNVITDRVEAMKILLPTLAGRQELADRFLREIKVLAGLNHPNIAQLRTALTIQDQLVMIMEYVEGTPIDHLVEQGPIPPADAVEYIDQVLQALGYAHAHKIIHRDIKPGNMMLTSDAVVKLMDFGIARAQSEKALTGAGMTLGSLYYMSPEQVRGQDIDHRADLYSVGVSLYEMVTGQRPFQADSDFSIMAAHVQQAPTPPITLHPDMPAELNEVILMAMAKEPDTRFQTADAFRGALKTVRARLAATPRPAPRPVVPPDATLIQGSTPAPAATMIQGSTPAPTAQVKIPTVGGLAAAPALAQAPLEPRRAPTPPPQPAAAGAIMAGAPPAKSSRVLYVTLGAIAVLIAVAASAVYLPRRAKTLAGTDATAITQQAQQAEKAAPNSAPAAAAPATTPEVATPTPPPAETPAPAAEPVTTAALAPSRNLAAAARKPVAAAQVAAPAAPAGPTAEEMEKLAEEYDQLSARTASVTESLNRLRQQQAASGFGLRGDMSAAHDMAQSNLARAQAAIRAHDAKGARKYLDSTNAQLEKLEKFLGR